MNAENDGYIQIGEEKCRAGRCVVLCRGGGLLGAGDRSIAYITKVDEQTTFYKGGNGVEMYPSLGMDVWGGATGKVKDCARCVGDPDRKCDLSYEIRDLSPQKKLTDLEGRPND